MSNITIQHTLERFRNAILSVDVKALSPLLSDKLSYGHSDGHVEGKEAFLEKLSDGRYHFLTMYLTNQTIIESDNIVVVRHELDAETNDEGKPNEAHLYVLLVWTRTGDNYQLIARQAVKKLPT